MANIALDKLKNEATQLKKDETPSDELKDEVAELDAEILQAQMTLDALQLSPKAADAELLPLFLYHAARLGDVDAVTTALKKGAMVDSCNLYGVVRC